MAQSMMRVTKKDILEMLKSYDDKDFVGVIFEAQDGKESPCHQVLVFPCDGKHLLKGGQQ